MPKTLWRGECYIPQRLEHALNFHDPSRRRKTLKYMAKQVERNRALRLRDFTDYWNLCPVMGENLNDPAVAYPTSLSEAENRLLERQRRDRELANAAKNAEMEAKLKKRLKKLERTYGFSFGGLTLRPVASIAELRAEGDALHHCVGSYAAGYSSGNTVICVLRRDVEPDRPWRTVEISPKTGKVVQDRGLHNDTPRGIQLDDKYRAALDMFWEAWGERKKRAG